jgi:hypothetical protein
MHAFVYVHARLIVCRTIFFLLELLVNLLNEPPAARLTEPLAASHEFLIIYTPSVLKLSILATFNYMIQLGHKFN